MAGGQTEIIRDDDPLVTAAHQGAADPTTFRHKGGYYDIFVSIGNYVENATIGAYGVVTGVTSDTITVDWLSSGGGGVTMGGDDVVMGGDIPYFDTPPSAAWSSGDVINVYRTGTKGATLSTNWVDLSRGWKTPPEHLVDGWLPTDVDLDENYPGRVFGPGQPESL